MPTSPTNKILKRTLVHEKFRPDRCADDPIWVRQRGEETYRKFSDGEANALYAEFAAAGRERFWDL
jgi:hypothetical protein